MTNEPKDYTQLFRNLDQQETLYLFISPLSPLLNKNMRGADNTYLSAFLKKNLKLAERQDPNFETFFRIARELAEDYQLKFQYIDNSGFHVYKGMETDVESAMIKVQKIYATKIKNDATLHAELLPDEHAQMLSLARYMSTPENPEAI